jgi:ribosomal protein L1
MDEERFNLDVRRFLKRFGITAQREIEKAVRGALAEGKLKGTETLQVHTTLRIDGLASDMRIDGRIALQGPPAEPDPE